jgi:hypothetical protein
MAVYTIKSGVGYETSLLLARNQIPTYATMRNLNKSDRPKEIASNEITI